MPIYEYLCLECGERFDVIRGINEPALDKCIKCSGAVKRLYVSVPVINFVGSGFHINDYGTGIKSNE